MSEWANEETRLAVVQGFNVLNFEDMVGVFEDKNLTTANKIAIIADTMRANFVSYTCELYPGLIYNNNFVSDLINHSMKTINWDQMARLWYYNNKEKVKP